MTVNNIILTGEYIKVSAKGRFKIRRTHKTLSRPIFSRYKFSDKILTEAAL